MEERKKYTKLHIYDFGPFKEAHIELAPLTIFIGKNSLGKSMLLYLIWVLEMTPMDYRSLGEAVIREGAMRLAEKCLAEVEAGNNPTKLLRQLLLLFLKVFPRIWPESLKHNLRSVFGTDISKLVRFGADVSKITIEAGMGEIELLIKGGELTARWIRLDEEIINEVNVKLMGKHGLTVFGEWETTIDFSSTLDILNDVLTLFEKILHDILGGFAGTSEGVENLLVDGRAGITRTLLTAYPGVSRIIREALSADFEFIDNMYRTARDFVEKEVDIKAPAFLLLLRELGFEPDIVEEFGIPRIYVKTWTDQRLPLERAPSGIRETMPVILALLSRNTSITYAEEPEAHLHPKAVRLVPRLMAYAINELGKHVRITTHSDILISQINNLIVMSADPEGAHELGYEPSELLRPEQVRAYLLKRADDHVEVMPLPVREDGFDEATFEEVAWELFEERSEVLRLLEAARRAKGKAGIKEDTVG